MAAARRVLFLLALVLAGLVAVHPGLGGVGETNGRPAVSRSGTGPLFDLPALAVGSSSTRTVTVTNSGTAAGVFVFGGTSRGSKPLAASLLVTVSSRGKTLYRDSLARLGTVRLGVLAPGESRAYSFRLELARGQNPLQSAAAAADFSISAAAA